MELQEYNLNEDERQKVADANGDVNETKSIKF